MIDTYIDRFADRKFGIFNHFLFAEPGSDIPETLPYEEENTKWNRQVDAYDPEKVAYALHKIGAGYYFITVMQGNRFMIAPNAAFDRICGTKPGEACSKRDLIADIIPALKKYDIDLCLYFTGDGPYKDAKCGPKMGLGQQRGQVSMEFVTNWAAVLEEYAVRYGENIKAWWVDGCYGEVGRGTGLGYTQELLEPYYNAIKKGNPNALTTFNNGVQREFYRWFNKEEYTSGEQNYFSHVPPSRFVDGAQTHLLIPLGLSVNGKEWGGWRQRGARISREQLKRYISYVNSVGGVVTIDIFIDGEGNLDYEQVEMLSGLMD
ncbi:MAG: alpha-L-fucosidase [Clostridia bacterium]|nr:alpha-L-fucosidase [Clostridia bacterium]